MNLKNKIIALLFAIGIGGTWQYNRKPIFEHHTGAKPTVERISPNFSLSDQTGLVEGAISNQDGSPIAPEQAEMASVSFAESKAILSSECFKTETLAAPFTETNGLTNGQILDLYVSKPITVGIQFFYGTWYQNYISKTEGFDEGDGICYVNTFYIDNADDLSSLELHETGHALGFSHVNPPEDQTSIPYFMNKIHDDCLGKP